MRTLSLTALLLITLIVISPQAELAQSGPAAIAPTEISADLGPCSALITVTGADSRPVYNAKVSTRVHYGFAGIKKLDLETYTSAAGQVNIVGLPENPKKPVFVYISKDDKLQAVEIKPELRCRDSISVQLQ